ncbi:10083_t:CDS:2, partial [Entrophospora sp. SA101]
VEQEKLQLALFWYREKLLQKLLTNQRGTVDIRSLRLNKSMLNVLKINEISYGIDISFNESKKILKQFYAVDNIFGKNLVDSTLLALRAFYEKL